MTTAMSRPYSIAAYDAREELSVYDDTILALDRALADADAARRRLDAARRTMDHREASLIAAGLPGKNEAERKAHLILACLNDDAFRAADFDAQDAAEELRHAECDVKVLTERTRLLRAALALAAGGR